MNDRFKFRAWIPEYKRFIERRLIDGHEVSLEWEQCTGLKDKNGKLIYEGDIIRCLYKTESYDGVVVWDKDEAGFSILVDGELYSFAQRKDDDVTIIIGNIHENPDY